MAIGKKKEKKNQEAAVNYNVKVRRAHEFKSGDIGFDADVNGITLYGLTYMNENPERNIKSDFISFPSRKGSDGKYYNMYFFKISDELLKDIAAQIEEII